MQNTAIISLDRYAELKDAESALIECVKDYKQVYYRKIKDAIGFYHLITSDSEIVMDLQEQLKLCEIDKTQVYNNNFSLQAKISELDKKIIEFKKELNQPWYKRLFLRR